jgi:glycosyltransferase involved in cell wall biosynthesis
MPNSAHSALSAPDHRCVAYLTNQYPAVSHTFIRREILALERLGIEVRRFAMRGWDAPLADAEDHAEREKTRYAQQDGIGALLADMLRTAITRPRRFYHALGAAVSMSRNGVRPLPYHLMYLAQACRLERWCAEAGIMHLHAHFGTNSAEVALLVHLLGGPEYSFTIHGQDEIEGAKGLAFPAKVGGSKFTVAVSAYCRSQILRELPHDDWPKLKVIHCGLDAGYFSDVRIPLPETPVFLCVARLSPEKGHLLLLDAFARLRADHPEARLVFAGDGPMREELEARIHALELTGAVDITGWVDAARIKAELAGSTALVQPSFIEGLPVVIMEAMARRRVVISTYVAGIPELVLPDKTGWLVPAGDPDALETALRKAISTDSETLLQMGDVGHDRVKERHLVDREAAKLAALFFGETC